MGERQAKCVYERVKGPDVTIQRIVTFLICLSTYSRADIFHTRPSNTFAFMCVLFILSSYPILCYSNSTCRHPLAMLLTFACCLMRNFLGFVPEV